MDASGSTVQIMAAAFDRSDVARAGDRRFDFAWGHGGQMIALVHDLDPVVVLVVDPFWMQHDGESWSHEKANLNLVGDFVASLPGN